MKVLEIEYSELRTLFYTNYRYGLKISTDSENYETDYKNLVNEVKSKLDEIMKPDIEENNRKIEEAKIKKEQKEKLLEEQKIERERLKEEKRLKHEETIRKQQEDKIPIKKLILKKKQQ